PTHAARDGRIVYLAPPRTITLRRLGLALHLRYPGLEGFEVAENLLPLERLPETKLDLLAHAAICGGSRFLQIRLELIAGTEGQVIALALGCGLRLAATAALGARLFGHVS